jgi:glyoxylase I family protein
MKISLEHIGLPAQAPVALRDWYERALGATRIFTDPKGTSCLLELAGGAMIEIYPGDSALKETANNKLSGWRHVALRVDSIDQAKAELERRGVQFAGQPGPAAGGGRVLFFQDPEGNLLHLVERPAPIAAAA